MVLFFGNTIFLLYLCPIIKISNIMSAITITDQNEMIEIGEVFLHQETDNTLEDVDQMSEFDKYYETREMIQRWNQLPVEQLANKQLGLEVQGFNIKD